MKKVTQQSDDMLLDFLDGKLDAQQLKVMRDSLQKDAELRSRLEELSFVHEGFKVFSLETPSANFTASIMTGLIKTSSHRGLSIRNGLMLLAGILVVLSIAVVLLSAGVFDQTTTVDLNSVDVAQRLLKQSLPSFSIDGKIVVNTIVLLNIIIAFVVLDRAVLKPFFQRRIEKSYEL